MSNLFWALTIPTTLILLVAEINNLMFQRHRTPNFLGWCACCLVLAAYPLLIVRSTLQLVDRDVPLFVDAVAKVAVLSVIASFFAIWLAPQYLSKSRSTDSIDGTH